jgi:hypothetical protein
MNMKTEISGAVCAVALIVAQAVSAAAGGNALADLRRQAPDAQEAVVFQVPAPQKVAAVAGNTDVNPIDSVIADMEQRIKARGGVPGDLNPLPAIDPATGFPNLQLPVSRTGFVFLFVRDHKEYVAANGDINEIWNEEYRILETTNKSVIAKYYVILLKYQLEQLGYNIANIDPITNLPNLEL